LVVVLQMFSGLNKRVAIKVGLDPTFVCRVARGQRNSPKVSEAIREELRAIRDYLNRTPKKLNGGYGTRGVLTHHMKHTLDGSALRGALQGTPCKLLVGIDGPGQRDAERLSLHGVQANPWGSRGLNSGLPVSYISVGVNMLHLNPMPAFFRVKLRLHFWSLGNAQNPHKHWLENILAVPKSIMAFSQ
jgi:hypothetical protein